MTNEYYLFIGGTHDGKRISLPYPPASYHRLCSKRPPFDARSLNALNDRNPIMIEGYRRERLSDGVSDIACIYVHDIVDSTEIIPMLIAKYRP